MLRGSSALSLLRSVISRSSHCNKSFFHLSSSSSSSSSNMNLDSQGGPSSSPSPSPSSTSIKDPSKDISDKGDGAYHTITTHQQYEAPPLDIPSLSINPIEQFSTWFSEAQSFGVPEPEGFSIATVDDATNPPTPSVRMVLLKQVDQRGFVFYTNYQSRKGREMGLNDDLNSIKGKRAAGVWYWKEMSRSVRIVGNVERLTEDESFPYYSTRPIGSQIGAHASPQSHIVKDRKELEDDVERFEDRYGIERGSADRKQGDVKDQDKKVPLPKYWGGVRIVPLEIEFWVGRRNR